MNKYIFSPEHAFNVIKDDITRFVENLRAENIVIGVSGGKDSTVAVALACKIFGKDRVIGVSLPCDGQKDMKDVDLVFDTFKIRRITIDVGDAFHSIINGIENNAVDATYDTLTNLPARLRMSTLYAVAQSVNGIVCCTANLTESILSYATLYGDHAGSYSPLWDLTVTEVIALGDWLGIPYELTHKVPIDGLQPLTDEQKLGFTYADTDKYIRENIGSDGFKKKVFQKYLNGKFKMDIVNIPHPEFNYPNYVINEN